MKSKFCIFIILIIFSLFLSCASKSPTISTQAANYGKSPTNSTQAAKIPDRNLFQQVKPGMTYTQVNDIIGEPDDWDEYQTGKAFIPFYFGSDVRCADALYKGAGTIVFATGGFGGEPTVIDVTCDNQ